MDLCLAATRRGHGVTNLRQSTCRQRHGATSAETSSGECTNSVYDAKVSQFSSYFTYSIVKPVHYDILKKYETWSIITSDSYSLFQRSVHSEKSSLDPFSMESDVFLEWTEYSTILKIYSLLLFTSVSKGQNFMVHYHQFQAAWQKFLRHHKWSGHSSSSRIRIIWVDGYSGEVS